MSDALDALYKAAVRREDVTEAAKLEEALEEQGRPRKPVVPTAHTAVWYASHGWPVFPLRHHAKIPAIPAAHELGSRERAECKGECGRLGHGLHDATASTGRAQEIFTKYDMSNIGIATGHLMDVIDIDPEGHEEVARRAQEDPAALAVTLLGIALTPRGGYHLWVPVTGRGNTANAWPGVDYRGKGGYVVAPPSYIDDGKAQGVYRWLLRPMLPPTEG